MCTVDKGWKVAKKDFKVYKKVTYNGLSEFNPRGRALVSGYNTRGTVLSYKSGKIVKSPSGPGIMAYTWRIEPGLIALLIKKGTRYHTGFNEGFKIICAEKVTVLGGKILRTIIRIT